MVNNSNNSYQKFTAFVHSIYGEGFIPLHRPLFSEDEKLAVAECIDSNFVSSAGKEIEVFEGTIADFTGAKYAIATVNGTAALHVALHLAGVSAGDEVITQAVSFVATANAVSYCRAAPVFIDVDRDTMGMSPEALIAFCIPMLKRHGQAFNKGSGAA